MRRLMGLLVLLGLLAPSWILAEPDTRSGSMLGREVYLIETTLLDGYAGTRDVRLAAGDSVTLLGMQGAYADVISARGLGRIPARVLATSLSDGDAMVFGDDGEDIWLMQKQLDLLGYMDETPSGAFDLATATAVLRFRAQAGLQDACVVGDEMLDVLYAENAPLSPILSARLAPGDTGGQVKRLQTRLTEKGFMRGANPGYYDAVTEQAVALFQRLLALPETGNADPETLTCLFSVDAPSLPEHMRAITAEIAATLPGSVQVKDWFDSDIQQIFAIETVAMLTDIETGIHWYEMRRGGTNHADVQPLTAQDTALFKTAAGGEWTWERRPIWVTIDGVRYAASMNCMPHGNGEIRDNDFNGHHCVHFLNSRTHGGNRLDERHQECVQIAAVTVFVPAAP